jgi:hypothetical protein
MRDTATETMQNDHTESVRTWFDEFFDENNIVNTIQHLLLQNDDTIEDLCVFITTANKSTIIMAMTSEGLVPFAGDHMYVFPFSRMNKAQLSALVREVQTCYSSFSCNYSHDQYVVCDRRHFKIDHATLLFGAACIVFYGLGNTTASKFGNCHVKLESPQICYYLNTILFRMVHACCMPQGVLHETAKLLVKHGVTVRQPS